MLWTPFSLRPCCGRYVRSLSAQNPVKQQHWIYNFVELALWWCRLQCLPFASIDFSRSIKILSRYLEIWWGIFYSLGSWFIEKKYWRCVASTSVYVMPGIQKFNILPKTARASQHRVTCNANVPLSGYLEVVFLASVALLHRSAIWAHLWRLLSAFETPTWVSVAVFCTCMFFCLTDTECQNARLWMASVLWRQKAHCLRRIELPFADFIVPFVCLFNTKKRTRLTVEVFEVCF